MEGVPNTTPKIDQLCLRHTYARHFAVKCGLLIRTSKFDMSTYVSSL